VNGAKVPDNLASLTFIFFFCSSVWFNIPLKAIEGRGSWSAYLEEGFQFFGGNSDVRITRHQGVQKGSAFSHQHWCVSRPSDRGSSIQRINFDGCIYVHRFDQLALSAVCYPGPRLYGSFILVSSPFQACRNSITPPLIVPKRCQKEFSPYNMPK